MGPVEPLAHIRGLVPVRWTDPVLRRSGEQVRLVAILPDVELVGPQSLAHQRYSIDEGLPPG